MRSLSLALIALFVAVNGAGVFRDLSAITKNSATVTTTTADGSTGHSISNLVAATTYVADGSAVFPLSFNLSYTGTLPASDNVFGYWDLYLTVTGPGSFPNYFSGATCTSPIAEPAGLEVSGGVWTRLLPGQLSYAPEIQAFALSATGSYTGTISLYRYGLRIAQSASFAFTVSTAATAPTKVTPTIDTFSLQASQTNSTPNIYTVLTPASIDVASTYVVFAAFNAPSPQGVAWWTNAANVGGVFDGGFSKFAPAVGFQCGNAFVPSIAGPSAFSGTPELPQATTITVAGITITKLGEGGNSVIPSGVNLQFASTVGSTDVTPPSCTAASFASTTVNTDNTPVFVVVTTTCTDATAVSLSGAFVRATSGAVQIDVFVQNGGTGFPVAPYIAGSLEIIGVAAIDTAGNAAVYGSCGSAAGQYATLCGGSASSTLIASLAVVMMCIMAVLAL